MLAKVRIVSRAALGAWPPGVEQLNGDHQHRRVAARCSAQGVPFRSLYVLLRGVFKQLPIQSRPAAGNGRN